MKFNIILEELLNEATPQEVYDKYYSNIPVNTYKRLISADPKTTINNDDGTIQKIGKYAKTIIDIWKADKLRFEDLPKATEYITLSYRFNIPLGDCKTLPEMYNRVKHKIAQTSTSISTILEQLKPEQYKVVLDGEEWYMFTPLDEMAASYLGINTSWCTTWGKYSLNPSYKDRENRFRTYNPQGPLYIMINKMDENIKYQLHFPSNQLKNPADAEVYPRETFFNDKVELGKYFFPIAFGVKEGNIDEIKKELTKGKFISEDKKDFLFEKYKVALGIGSDKLPIVDAILNDNEIELQEAIFGGRDHDVDSDVYVDTIHQESIEFSFKDNRLPGYLSTIESYVGYIQRHKQEAYETVREDVYNNNEWMDNNLEEFISDYYRENSKDLIKLYGSVVDSERKFKAMFVDDFIKNEKIREKYSDVYTDRTSTNLENALQKEIVEIEKYIPEIHLGWASASFQISKTYFIEYIIKEKIVFDSFDKIIEGYIEEYGLPTSDEYYEYPEYDYESPDYDDMRLVIEEYFEQKEEEMFGQIKGDESDCGKVKGELVKIMSQYLPNGQFENEHVSVKIKAPWTKYFTCEDGGKIEIEYKNKDKNTNYNGYVRVENLMKYITNHDLFEQHRTFKKLINF
jgi:hypothetical protein